MKKSGFAAIVLLASLSVAAQAEDAKVVDRKSPDYVKCVRLEETGSLVKKTRVCKTNAEWDKIGASQNREAVDLIDRNRSGMNGQ